MRARRLSAWLLALAGMLAVRGASAGTPIELVYLRSGKAESCPDQATLEHAVMQRLGYNPFFAVAERKVIASISSNGGALHARATLVDKGVVRGNRELTARATDCRELIASLALAISITLDPMSLASPEPAATTPDGAAPVEPAAHDDPPAPADPPTPVPGVAANPSPDVAAVKPAEAAAPSSVDLTIVAAMVGTVGVLPQFSPEWRLGVEGRRGTLSLAIEGAITPKIAQTAVEGGEAAFSLLVGSIVPCLWWGPVGSCAVVSMGSLSGEGRGVLDARQESRFYAATGVRVVAVWSPARAVGLALQAEGAVTLTRPTFELGEVEVWRPPPLSAQGGLAFFFHFL